MAVTVVPVFRSSAVSPTSPGYSETVMASDRAGYHSASMDIAGGGGAGGRGGSQSGGGGTVGASAAVSTSFRVGSPSSGGSADQNEVIRRWNMEVRGVPIAMGSSFTRTPLATSNTTPVGRPGGDISPEIGSAVSATGTLMQGGLKNGGSNGN